MRAVILGLLTLTVGLAVSKDADKVISDHHYLCLNTIAAGLDWRSGKWVATTFHPLGEFQLEITVLETVFSDGSTHKFIHFTRDGDSGHGHCGAELPFFTLEGPVCTQAGITIMYSEEGSRGGISMLLGSESTEDQRDSLVVMPFTCQKR